MEDLPKDPKIAGLLRAKNNQVAGGNNKNDS